MRFHSVRAGVFCAAGLAASVLLVESAVAAAAPNPYCDYNENGVCDAADYTVWRDNYGRDITLPNTDPSDTDGRVTLEEYAFWVSRFGEVAGSASGPIGPLPNSGGVPEPSSAALLIIGAGALAAGRRSHAHT